MSKELTNFINEHILLKRFNSNATKESFWVKRNSIHLYKELNDLYPNLILQQQVYNYLNNTNNGICEKCGIDTKFISFKYGYSKYCSKSCAQKSEKTREKYKDTMIKKYGKESNLSGDTTGLAKNKHGEDVFKKANEKSKETKLKKYGNENYNNTEKNKETRIINNNTHSIVAQKMLLVNPDPMKKAREKFNLDNNCSNPSELSYIQEKKKKNSIEKYGLPFQAKHITKEHYILLDNKEYLQNNSVEDIMLETGIGQTFLSKQMIKHKINSGLRSQGELSIVNFIKSFYDGEILTNKRKMFGTEIDIYIPEFNFGIEYNGSYWHSDNFKKTHKDKFDIMNDRGDYLLQIFDFEWKNKREIYESKIKLKMGIFNERIYARKCIIQDVNSKEAREFLDKNHLQGFVKSSVKKGLYYNNELVSLMTFGKSRFKKDEYELIRFVNKINTVVVGGASKLFKNILRTEDIKNIISFSDNFYSNGNLYNQLGFEKVSESQGFFYLNIKDNTRVNRINFQKHKLEELFENFDSSVSASENVKNNGYYKIFDAGQIKWVYQEL